MTNQTKNSDQAICIHFDDVTVSHSDVKILDGLTATIEAGKITAILGPNGAGKTTLLKTILGLVPYSGKIKFHRGHTADNTDGNRPTVLNPKIGYVPQQLNFDRGIPITVQDFLRSCFSNNPPLWLGSNKKERIRITEILEKIGMPHLLNSPLGKLSGGELQRILLAQALLQEPEVLLLDEPSSAVDIEGEALFCDLLQSVHQERHLTTVWVSHDLSVVSHHANEVICINRNLICSGQPEHTLTSENIREIFGPHSTVYAHHDHGHAHNHDH